MQNLRVLVFSATFGNGHLRAAEAVIDAIKNKKPNAEIIHADFGEFISEPFNAVIKNTYIELIKHTPKLWGKFYYGTAKISPRSPFQRFLNNLGRTQYINYIQTVQPDVIICTYPTVAGVLARLRLKNILNIPLVAVVTDYTVHSQWIHHGVDLYIVGCEEVYHGLVKRGISPDIIKVTGIPVSPKFECDLNREEIKAKLGLLSARPTFLIMGGAYGVLGGAKEICRIFAEAPFPVQSIIVCGKDKKLYKSLDDIINTTKNPMVRFGYVNNVEELMTASDIIITKAGGLTVSEALTKGLPLVIFKPIPGQEEENAKFLMNVGAGVSAYNIDEIKQIIYSLAKDSQEMDKMRLSAANALPGRAAERTAEYILQLINNKKEKIG